MKEKKSSFPNVSLAGKLNKQKETDGPGYLRYNEKDQQESKNNK